MVKHSFIGNNGDEHDVDLNPLRKESGECLILSITFQSPLTQKHIIIIYYFCRFSTKNVTA